MRSLYKKEFLNTIRFLSIVSIIFLTFVEVKNKTRIPLIENNISINYHSLQSLIENGIVIILGILLVFYPYRLEYMAIASFIYCLECLVFEVRNPMGICMFFLGIVILYIRGFFIKYTINKLIISIIVLLGLLFSRLHFGMGIFLDTITENIGYILVLSILVFLIVQFHQSKLDSIRIKTLNLAEYPLLNETDILLLQKVLENKQYKIISAELLRSEGTIRNRLNKIYDILGVMDRTGFITTYTGYKIVFDKDKKELKQLSTIKKKK